MYAFRLGLECHANLFYVLEFADHFLIFMCVLEDLYFPLVEVNCNVVLALKQFIITSCSLIRKMATQLVTAHMTSVLRNNNAVVQPYRTPPVS